MRRISIGIVTLALVLAFVAPLTAQAAYPSPANMLKEQVASRTMISALVGTLGNHGSWISSISFGHITRTSDKAVISLTARTSAGTNVPGVLVMKKYLADGNWYFYSITRGTHEFGVSQVIIPSGIYSSTVWSAITAQRSHQYLVTGILFPGYKKLTVLSRHMGYNTRTVNIRLSGGYRSSTLGRIVAYHKTAHNGTGYWFLAAFK
jgi:hypothetical protein